MLFRSGPDSSLNRILSFPFSFSTKSTPDESIHELSRLENSPKVIPRHTVERKTPSNFRKSAKSTPERTIYEKRVQNSGSIGFRGRRRTKDPDIELVLVPTRFDPSDEKVVVGIMADWILRDIEKEHKEKQM